MMNRRGQAVILAYVTVAVLTVLGGSLLNRALSASQLSQTRQLHNDVFYLAEGGLEDAIGKFAQDVANFQISSTATRYPAVGSLVTAFTSGATASSVIDEFAPGQGTVVDPDGISIFVKNYRITTTVAHPANPTVTVTLHQTFTRRIIYTFQHAVFYDGDLEWLPGANMSLSGRIHSNSDIYLATESGKTLTVDSEYLRAVGSLYHKRKDSAAVPSGFVQILKADSNPATYPVLSTDSTSATWTTDSQTTWNGTVKTSVHGVTKRAVPVVGSTTPGGFYDSNAQVKIIPDPNNAAKCAVMENGFQLVEGTNIPLDTCKTTTTLYNSREGKYVKMADVDLGKLGGGTYNGVAYPNHLPANGLIYATRSDAPASQEPGIRLLNSSEVKRAGGLTVVSNDPVYIQGNFNTTSKKPVAVIADALSLLSNAWSDSNSASGIGSRVATATTVNSAFIAGNKPTPTGGGAYSGGLENYPRLQEDWSGKQLTISGSFVSLWSSQIATGNWPGTGTVYKAPTRIWAYDASFSSGSTLPPFTPWAVEIVRGAWWKE